MAKYERDSYEPEDVRVFDGGHDDEDSEGSHLPMVIVISLLVLAAFGGVVWLAYNNGVAHGRNDVPTHTIAQNTGASTAPAVAPDNSQTSAPVKAIKVYQQPAGADEDTGPAPASAPPPAQLNKVAAPAAAPALRAPTVETKPVQVAASETKKPVVPPPVAVTQSTLAPVKTQTKPLPQVATAPPASLLPAKTTPVAAAPTTVTKPVKTTPAAVPATAGAYVLQIGAYKSEADAGAAWKAYQAKHSTLLSGVSSSVQKADLGGKGVWYRLRAGAFADKDTAAAMCTRLQAEGGACFPAK